MRGCLDREEISLLGNELRAGLAVTGVYVLKETGRLPDGIAVPIPVTDYVLSQLSDSRPSCDVTHAASLGGLNLETSTWHWSALGKLGFDTVQWPQIRCPGEVAYLLPMQRGTIPCYAPLGDHQCAVLGTQLTGRELSINVSTGAQVANLTKKFVPGDYQTRPYVDGRYLNTVTHIPAGRALNMLVDLLTELPRTAHVPIGDPWPLIEQAVRGVTETDMDVGLSFYESAVGARGKLGNLRAENLHVGHVFRGAFESMAANFFACSQRLGATAFHGLVLSGGLVRKSATLRSVICERFQLPHRMGGTEETMLGLLTYALLASGRASSFSEASRLLVDS
jgi:sugar (pentulose or hexulose) kinase